MQTPLHIQRFNDKIKLLNQGSSRELVLTAAEARNLHTEVFGLLAEIAQLQDQLLDGSKTTSENANIEIQMDGGGFS